MTEDLDRWLATELMGYKLVCSPDCIEYPLPYCEDKVGNRFSFRPTDPNTGQIWLVVEKMRERGWIWFKLQWNNRDKIYQCLMGGKGNSAWGQDPNPCLAIAKAIKAALEGK